MTTLIGAGQGLFLALYMGDIYSFVAGSNSDQMMLIGIILVILLMNFGLLVSLLHLGRLERSWRAVTQWRTSWLSREVIALLAFICIVTLWGVIRLLDNAPIVTVFGVAEIRLSLIVGFVATILAVLLYVCTAMIYATIKAIQEWTSVLTVINYLLLGITSGFTLATALASYFQSPITEFYVACSITFIVSSGISKTFSLYRNARINYKNSKGVVLGIKHPKIHLITQGKMGRGVTKSKFNYQTDPKIMLLVKGVFLIAIFVLPLWFMIIGWARGSTNILVTAVLIQYLGLLTERWFFFAEVNHPQKVYA